MTSSVTRNIAPNRMGGFTLLELLVSMTIVSLLATTVLFGWRVAVSAWEKASSHLQKSRTVLATNHLLQEQMASMVPYRGIASTGFHLFFQGEPLTARFLSRYSLTGRANSGLYRIEYQVVEAEDGTKQLLMNEVPVTSREELGALIQQADPASFSPQLRFAPFERGPRTVVLLAGVKDCRFEYYKAASALEAGTWVPEWLGTMNELPRAMAIRITPSDDPAGVAPASVVAAIRDFSIAPVSTP
ncbi:MAG: prepilin-type N-terminal cleavage/methylation domain-containing protein [Acidobacteria bacterium]|nr:prepilin-type N-terminal cleavage/methylation domain-containing protein [Acidobacteriota bacterium]